MKAAVRDVYGGPEVVRIEEVDRPTPTGAQVLVRVRAASVNRADLDGLYPRWQFTRLFLGLRRPRARRLGIDVAGVVESVGPDTTRFKPGDHVFADLFGFGASAFAEYVCAAERAFAPIPAGMAFDEASTLPHSAVLAMQSLRLRNGRTIGPGDRVLIVGASGNVGPFAVQIAKSMGAEVTGVCRTEKVEFVRSLGADHVIDYTAIDYTRTGDRYDWIVDVDAHHWIFRWRNVLRPNGAYVTLGASTAWMLPSMLVGPIVGRLTGTSMGLLLWWKPFHAKDVERLAGLVATGELRPRIDRRFSLSEVVEALRHVDEGRARGKAVVVMDAA